MSQSSGARGPNHSTTETITDARRDYRCPHALECSLGDGCDRSQVIHGDLLLQVRGRHFGPDPARASRSSRNWRRTCIAISVPSHDHCGKRAQASRRGLAMKTMILATSVPGIGRSGPDSVSSRDGPPIHSTFGAPRSHHPPCGGIPTSPPVERGRRGRAGRGGRPSSGRRSAAAAAAAGESACSLASRASVSSRR